MLSEWDFNATLRGAKHHGADLRTARHCGGLASSQPSDGLHRMRPFRPRCMRLCGRRLDFDDRATQLSRGYMDMQARPTAYAFLVTRVDYKNPPRLARGAFHIEHITEEKAMCTANIQQPSSFSPKHRGRMRGKRDKPLNRH